jgi:hypothetical protein
MKAYQLRDSIGGKFPVAGAKKTNGKCEVDVFAGANEKVGKSISCNQIQCIKGECGGEGEYTSVPIEQQSGSSIQILMKDGQKVWLRFPKLPEIDTILFPGREGNLFPATTQVFESPNGKLVKPASSKKMAYKVVSIAKVGKEEWASVEIRPILSDEPPVELGKAVGMGHFLYRDREDRIKAVLSEIWCD